MFSWQVWLFGFASGIAMCSTISNIVKYLDN